MRLIASAITLFLAFASCANKKPAEEPENSDESASSEESTSESKKATDKPETESDPAQSNALATSGIGRGLSARAEKATVKDDTEREAVPCSGMKIANLLASISQAACELPEGATASTQQAKKDILEVTLAAAPKIAPGSTAQIGIVLKNKGKTKLPLDFTVDPDPRFTFELYTPKGARVDKPAGNEPALPAEVSDAALEARLARVTLDPNGTATLVLPWQAVKYKWAPKEKAKGALAGHGYPREPAGPLPRGKYVLRIVMPLANVDETVDHEITQPRVNIEIAGTPEVAAPPPAASAAPKPPPASASAPPAASASESQVEAKFLKAVGAAPPATSAHPPPKKR
jgi:hypothetical protein